MLATLAMLACAAQAVDTGAEVPDDPAATCGPEGGYQHWIVDTLAFARIEDGVSAGFDLDNAVSTTGGSTGCGIEDLVSPDGTPGIDNAFGRLLPVLDNTEFVAAEGLIDASIRNGELVMVGELAGLDAPVGPTAQDDCVRMALRRGGEAPQLGTDGLILAGQTIALDSSFDDPSWEEVPVVDGRTEARPLTVSLPLEILNATVEFELLDGALRFEMAEDGSMSGAFAGGLDTDALRALLSTEGVSPELSELADPLLDVIADLAPDESGQCTQLSVTLRFTAVPGYVFSDELE